MTANFSMYPWWANRYGTCVHTAIGLEVCEVHRLNGGDANLIAAAPEMYAALSAIMLEYNDLEPNDPVFEVARAAIAKAEGRQP